MHKYILETVNTVTVQHIFNGQDYLKSNVTLIQETVINGDAEPRVFQHSIQLCFLSHERVEQFIDSLSSLDDFQRVDIDDTERPL